MPDFRHEILAGRETGQLVCGLDEVGRGPLAGPVMAAAVLFPLQQVPEFLQHHLNDSKQLSERKREALYPLLTSHCAYAVAEASVEEIDRLNILRATFLAMERAFQLLEQRLGRPLDMALIDGNRAPALPCPTQPIVKGDAKSLSIAAASVIAKVTRDRFMKGIATDFPGYGWERNAGYGTATHREAIDSLGLTPWHRRSFAPVAEAMRKAG